jgi:effector-binding domain-containing protein
MNITYEITEQDLPGQTTAVMRGEMAAQELPQWLARAYRDVYEYLDRTGVIPAGPPFARYTFLDDVVAIEAGFPVPFEVSGEGLIEPSALPPGAAAVTTHLGRYEDLTHALDAVTGWLEARGRAPHGPHWEIYYTDPGAEPDPARWRTDVVVPYRPAD